ncbi:MAG: MotA/TolQ/ExbB proton channel family protein [Acidobacteriota bacterium]
MNMSVLVDLAGTGATWVLYFLIALSAIQLAVIGERAIVYYRSRAPGRLAAKVRDALATGSTKAVTLAVAGDRSLEARTVAAGAASAERGAYAVRELMHAASVEERLRLERGLSFLGTVGNNAPFIGLFGTVLGVIHATQSLATTSGHGAAQVMSGISEALISTAVGLLVALPAVAAFNYFQRILKTRAVAADGLGSELIAHLASDSMSSTRKAA